MKNTHPMRIIGGDGFGGAWVRLQIEPVEVASDEGGIVFSSVQSVVPGAHGLYYREGEQRRPLEYDTTTGKVLAPASGWDAQDIYIHLAHGSKHGSHYADYAQASQQFEKNIFAVQKLIEDDECDCQRDPSRNRRLRVNSRQESFTSRALQKR
ncbi:hypothetical protein DICVIV_11207 [Dictyocaulus viviparus]|uniref:TAR DNA-binding protein 43 N-terminal domain-containing protein n=1 Tax=Dictyocaulus viviparus TaxID=29172 RepID=A0A0D8XGF6_DICVI|nr:hypothetical protein DICVIV_11207 [Dictyocaulus viviparus]